MPQFGTTVPDDRAISEFVQNNGGSSQVSGALTKWHPVTVDFSGPAADESDVNPNPFLDYRLNVTLTAPNGSTTIVPGYFAGDGNGGGSGNIWRIRFSPDQEGVWTYQASIRAGAEVALSLDESAGMATTFDVQTGSFEVAPRDEQAPGFLSQGRLEYVDNHYLKFRDGEFWIKGGIDSPENFFGYDGFDNTETNGFIHRYPTHVGDWETGDPNFTSATSGYEGKAIIGALNYLASEQINSFYFLPMNLGGDGKDTYPFLGNSGSDFDNTHYDISKLEQWDTVLEYAQTKGIAAHFVLNETESANENWLDNGSLGTQRKLFYRELVARFGYLLAAKWNLSEENDYSISDLQSFGDYIATLDWSNKPIAVHTNLNNFSDYNQLLGNPLISATSIQYSPDNAGQFVETWRLNSTNAGRPWVLDMDENAPANVGLNQNNAVELRKRVLYDVYFSGGQIEWYFGGNGQSEGGDQNTEDFRTRQEMYRYMYFARRMMRDEMPFWLMQPADNLVSNEDSSFGGAEVFVAVDEVYAVYLPDASGNPVLDLSDAANEFEKRWFNPESGAFEGVTTQVRGGSTVEIGDPPSRNNEDWVVIFTVADDAVDSDSDGISDTLDNCLLVENAAQIDVDADGYGNACDPDFNNDCSVNFIDYSDLTDRFLNTNEDLYDLTGDGVINFDDVLVFSNFFQLSPGPSGTTQECTD
ncbi:MAG: DUF5060 domain-containing protein [Gammaproteobacteria bacterium]